MSSFGEDLKRERELRKISLREIAEATKINARYLDALENNDFKRLPGGVFNKGFVRAFAQHIGVDEEVMVNAYLLEQQAQNNRDATSEGEALRGNYGDRFTGTGESRNAPPAGDRKRLLLAVVAVLAVIVALAVGWLLFSKEDPVPVKTGETELTAPPTEPDISIVDENDIEVEAIESGGMLRVRIRFEVRDYLKSPEIVVGTHTTDFLYLCAGSTAAIPERPDYPPGIHEIEYIVPNLPFANGTYCIRFAVFDRHRRKVFGGETLKVFNVTSTGAEFYEAPLRNLDLRTEWKLDGKRYRSNDANLSKSAATGQLAGLEF